MILKDKEGFIELLYSDQDACIIIIQEPNIMDKEVQGKIIKKTKKELKKQLKKASEKDIKKNNIVPLDSIRKDEIIKTYLTDKIGIIKYTEEYIELMKKSQIKKEREEIEQMTEKEREELLESLSD